MPKGNEKMRNILAALICLAASLPAIAQAQSGEPMRLSPSSDWALNYADDGCELSRRFGAGDNQVLLGMRSYQPGGLFWLSVIGRPTAIGHRPDTIRITLGSVEALRVGYWQGDFGGTPGIQITNPITLGPGPEGLLENLRAGRPVASWSEPATEARVTEMGLVDGLEREFVLETGSMGPPMTALKECTRELTTHWPINVTQHEQLDKVAVEATRPWLWLETRNYPRELRRPGPVNYRLMIDAAGEITDCAVPGADSPEFAEATCAQLLREASFHPARNAAGEPVADYYINWTVLAP